MTPAIGQRIQNIRTGETGVIVEVLDDTKCVTWPDRCGRRPPRIGSDAPGEVLYTAYLTAQP